jgi:hypothetical protein
MAVDPPEHIVGVRRADAGLVVADPPHSAPIPLPLLELAARKAAAAHPRVRLEPKTQEAGGACLPASCVSVDTARCQAMAAPKRKPASASKERPVKTTISLDLDLYSRLCAKAAKRRTGISALAVEFIREGLRGVVVFDKSDSSDRVRGDDRRTEGIGISPDDQGEAA